MNNLQLFGTSTSRRISFLMLILISFAISGKAQTDASIDKLDVFLECSSCDMTYVRQKVDQVNYVRDRADAHVHVMVLVQRNGSGGNTVTLTYMGKQELKEVQNQLSYFLPPQITRDESRKLFVKHFKMGLVAYWLHTDLGDQIQVSIADIGDSEQKPKGAKPDKDPWHHWVFRMTGGGSFNKETTRSSLNYSFNVSANHVTPDLRVRTQAYLNLNQQVFNNDDGDIRSERERRGFSGSIVKSLNNHWSYGLFGGIYSSTYANIDASLYASPALEYNIFPYDEVMRREFTLAYKVGPSFRNYIQETIYEKFEESLFRHSLEMALRLRQPWGSVFVGVEGSHFFHDVTKNSIEFNSRLDFRLIKGLAVNLRSNVEFIRDQLSLPAGSASLEEILLKQTQLATDFESFVSVGVSYTFGSMYNNIVNTRL